MAYPLPPITKVDFSSSQYIAEEHPKKQIYLHHTAGNSSAQRTFQGWNANADKIATCVAISGKGSVDGEIVQGFSSKHWAYHLCLNQYVFTLMMTVLPKMMGNGLNLSVILSKNLACNA